MKDNFFITFGYLMIGLGFFVQTNFINYNGYVLFQAMNIFEKILTFFSCLIGWTFIVGMKIAGGLQ